MSRKLIWHLYPAFLVIGIAVLFAVTWSAAHSFHVFYYNQIANNLEVRAGLIEQQVEPVIKSGNFSEIDAICKSLGKKGRNPRHHYSAGWPGRR